MTQPILSIRKRLGLSQEALSAELGVSQGSVSNYERGTQRMPVEVARNLIAAAARRGVTLSLDEVYAPVLAMPEVPAPPKPPLGASCAAHPAAAPQPPVDAPAGPIHMYGEIDARERRRTPREPSPSTDIEDRQAETRRRLEQAIGKPRAMPGHERVTRSKER